MAIRKTTRLGFLRSQNVVVFIKITNTARTIIEECTACSRLLRNYEAATFDLAKIQNRLIIAQYLRDDDSHRRLILEADETTARLDRAREAFRQHQAHHKSDRIRKTF